MKRDRLLEWIGVVFGVIGLVGFGAVCVFSFLRGKQLATLVPLYGILTTTGLILARLSQPS